MIDELNEHTTLCVASWIIKHGAKGNSVNSISLGSCLYTILTTEEKFLYGKIPFTSLNGFGENINVSKQSY